MVERRARRSDKVYAAVQLYLESYARRHACRAVVLATEDGSALAGAGSEEDLFVIGRVARCSKHAAANGVHRFAVTVGAQRFYVGAAGKIPEAECVASLTRILACA
jgi:hypothetical protein